MTSTEPDRPALHELLAHQRAAVVAGPEGADPPLTTSRPTALVPDFYRDQCRRSDAIIEATPRAS